VAAGVPCSAYRTPADVLDDEHLRQRGSFASFSNARGDFTVLNPPFRFADVVCSALPVVGALGQHTREVLESVLSVDADALAALARDGAFGT
jgi:crotonobetainyl-CoA:carnitine CoA-transferase CaiB-like acyl-CoA transferase